MRSVLYLMSHMFNPSPQMRPTAVFSTDFLIIDRCMTCLSQLTIYSLVIFSLSFVIQFCILTTFQLLFVLTSVVKVSFQRLRGLLFSITIVPLFPYPTLL